MPHPEQTPQAHAQEPLLQVENLTTVIDSPTGRVAILDDVSLTVGRGETLGLVGESGSGKSMTAFSILQLLDPPLRVASGRVVFQGRDLLTLPETELRHVRGAGIGFVFQEPMAALNPAMRVGAQIAEALTVHGLATRRQARQRAVDLLRAMHIDDPERRADDYPHQLSGGMLQRVMIAIALACRPALLIADEPTTALDVTIQAQVIDLLRELRREFQIALLLVTHDFGVIAELADRVAVMYAGRIVEQGDVRAMLRAPRHPYTQALLASLPGSAAGGRLAAIDGAVPDLAQLPPGCAFAPRCRHCFDPCLREVPPPVTVAAGHSVRCHLYSSGHGGDDDAVVDRGDSGDLPAHRRADSAHAGRT